MIIPQNPVEKTLTENRRDLPKLKEKLKNQPNRKMRGCIFLMLTAKLWGKINGSKRKEAVIKAYYYCCCFYRYLFLITVSVFLR